MTTETDLGPLLGAGSQERREVDVDLYPSLKDLFADSARRFADLPAYRSMGATVSYRELDEASRAFGAWLQNTAGLRRGDRIALMLPNLLQFPIALYGALRAGLVVVNTNPLYTPRELEHQLKDSGATAIVVLENFAATLAQVVAATPVKTVITTEVGDRLPRSSGCLSTRWCGMSRSWCRRMRCRRRYARCRSTR